MIGGAGEQYGCLVFIREGVVGVLVHCFGLAGEVVGVLHEWLLKDMLSECVVVG